jgi:hypothetical protein
MMRMALLRLIVVLLAGVLGGQSLRADEAVYPPGSRLGLVPLSGMATSMRFFGFEDANTQAAIILAALPAEAYAGLEKSMTAESLKREGVILEKRETMPLPTGKAFLVIGRQQVDKQNVRKWILIGSSPALTALVTVQIPERAKNAYSEAAIRASLSSLNIREHVPLDEQLSLLPFQLGELAGFEVSAVMPGRAVLLKDPSAEAGGRPQSHMFVSVAPGGPAQAGGRDAFASDLFAAIPNIRNVRVSGAEPLRIGGQAGHQILAQAKDPAETTDLSVVQWVRFGGGGYLQLVGIARSDAWRDAYPRFRAVRDGIEPR